MIPLKDENPTRSTPVVVAALIAINVAVYVYNGDLLPGFRNPLAGFELIPYEVVTGRNISPAPVSPWLTIFTSAFIHGNFLHLAGNMLYLWIFGNNIEDVLGHFKFLIFYLASAVVASFAQIMVAPLSTIPMVGASGAIAGVMGAYMVLFPEARIISLLFFFFVQVIEVPALVVLGLWIIHQIVSLSIMDVSAGGVAYAAHVGGFVAGASMILMLGGKRLLRGRRPYYRYYRRYYY